MKVGFWRQFGNFVVANKISNGEALIPTCIVVGLIGVVRVREVTMHVTVTKKLFYKVTPG